MPRNQKNTAQDYRHDDKKTLLCTELIWDEAEVRSEGERLLTEIIYCKHFREIR